MIRAAAFLALLALASCGADGDPERQRERANDGPTIGVGARL